MLAAAQWVIGEPQREVAIKANVLSPAHFELKSV
jgi:hypothetical protein